MFLNILGDMEKKIEAQVKTKNAKTSTYVIQRRRIYHLMSI